jgi:hypothetical protein
MELLSLIARQAEAARKTSRECVLPVLVLCITVYVIQKGPFLNRFSPNRRYRAGSRSL